MATAERVEPTVFRVRGVYENDCVDVERRDGRVAVGAIGTTKLTPEAARQLAEALVCAADAADEFISQQPQTDGPSDR